MTTPARPGIPTTYRGANFRSRLEAHWAAFFDRLGWRWTYEPVDVFGYIPDFLVHGARPLFVEVGPCITPVDYHDKARKATENAADLRQDVLVVGVSPVAPFLWSPQFASAGWLGEFFSGDDRGDYPALEFDIAVWGRCFECGTYGPVHVSHSYVIRPCGHHQSGSFGDFVSEAFLEAAWRRAGNDVQWHGPQSVGSILRTVP